MAIEYRKLFRLMQLKGKSEHDLLQIIDTSTLSHLKRGTLTDTSVLDKLCSFLQCQPGDIMQYIHD